MSNEAAPADLFSRTCDSLGIVFTCELVMSTCLILWDCVVRDQRTCLVVDYRYRFAFLEGSERKTNIYIFVTANYFFLPCVICSEINTSRDGVFIQESGM